MNPQKLLVGASALLALSHPAAALDIDPYGSLRIGVEAVSPDADPDYEGFRDAYSRVGIKFTDQINADWTVMAQLELPLDLANFDVHSPYDTEEEIRIAKLQVSGPLGTLWYGRGWMAFYNAIAYPVDYFSSYYSGWATGTTFRREKTLYYSSPSIKGFNFAFATSDDNSGTSDNRNQYTVSYSQDGIYVAAGLDDNAAGAGPDDSILGLAASYTTGPWYVAGKYERFDSSTSLDGGDVKNLLVQYKVDDKNTVRGMIADVDFPNGFWYGEYGGTVVHLGWDHQYDDDLKLFVEYYQEETTAAIGTGHDDFFASGYIRGSTSGGSVITTGVRYDF